MLRPNVVNIPTIKPKWNVGCLLDIPTGSYVEGPHGEMILNGGLNTVTGFTGQGNSFKSTIMHYMMLSAMDKVMYTEPETFLMTYDTEINIEHDRLLAFSRRFPNLAKHDVISEGLWIVTDKSYQFGDQWYEDVKNYLTERANPKNAKSLLRKTPFFDKVKNDWHMMKAPVFIEIDSFTEFESSDVINMQDKNKLGDSGANTMYMRAGLIKARLVSELPRLLNSGGAYCGLVAHLGKDNDMGGGPPGRQPEKRLQHMKGGEKMVGVSGKFYYLIQNGWYMGSTKLLTNSNTRAPEYPSDSAENEDVGSKDLNEIKIQNLRGKSGPSGIPIPIVVSQREGVLPHLTLLHYLRTESKYFGMGGNNQSFFLEIYPDVVMSRTKVRSQIDTDPKLRRALEITADLLQIKQYRKCDESLWCDPKTLFEDIKKAGYDWDEILSTTRGWWCFDNDSDKHDLKFLSTMDLLNMRAGKYKPFWKK